MKSFFKIFLSTLAALVVFSLIVFFLFVGWVTGLASKSKPSIDAKSVLVLDLGQNFKELRFRDLFLRSATMMRMIYPACMIFCD